MTNTETSVPSLAVVPVKPTLAMLAAGYDALKLFFPQETGQIGQYRVYEAMLAAAPSYEMPQDAALESAGRAVAAALDIPFSKNRSACMKYALAAVVAYMKEVSVANDSDLRS